MTNNDAPDDAIADALLARAERGTHRGADDVFDASGGRRPMAGRVLMATAAALLLVVGGLVVVRTTRSGDSVSVGGTTPVADSTSAAITDPDMTVTTDPTDSIPTDSVTDLSIATTPSNTLDGAMATTPPNVVDGSSVAPATTEASTSPAPTAPASTRSTPPSTPAPETAPTDPPATEPASTTTLTPEPEPQPIDPARLTTVGAIDAAWTVNPDGTVTATITPGTNTGTALWRSEDLVEPVGDRIVVEFAVTASRAEYESSAWAEIVLTTASRSTGQRRDALFATDVFPGHWTLGCRVTADRTPTCVLMDDSTGGTRDGARVWQASFFENAGTGSFGGFPSDETDAAWRVCAEPSTPLTECFDRFRLELTRTSFTLFVNDVRYFEQTGLPELPTELFGNAYTYRAASQSRSEATSLTFLWSAF